jgi:hypothetical protein
MVLSNEVLMILVVLMAEKSLILKLPLRDQFFFHKGLLVIV